jgi:integrase
MKNCASHLAIIATLLYTGARIGEALLVDVADVRFDEGVILVPTLKQRKSRPPKRRLRLWPHLAALLGPVVEARRELFLSSRGRRLKAIRRAFATLLGEAVKHGVRAELEVQDLRRCAESEGGRAAAFARRRVEPRRRGL